MISISFFLEITLRRQQESQTESHLYTVIPDPVKLIMCKLS